MTPPAPPTRTAMKATAITFAAALLATAGAGCNMIKLPEAPVPIATPQVTVDRVELVDSSDAAGRYLIYLTLTNPNDVPLPMTDARYTLGIGGGAAQEYDGDAAPNATLPASGSIQIKLPAVVTGRTGFVDSSGAQPYEVDGSIRVFPPGQLKMVGYEMGIPRPWAPFAATGAVTMNLGGEEADVVLEAPDEAVEGDTTSPTAPRRDPERTEPRPDEAPETPGVDID